MKIEILGMKKLDKGSLRGFVSVGLGDGDIVIHDIRIMTSKKGGLWCALPSKEYTDKTGAKKWSNIVEMSEGLKADVQNAILDEYEGNQPAVVQNDREWELGDDSEIPF